MTRAEGILRAQLRGSRLNGAIPGLRPGDRRQIPFDRFVLDFYCHAAELAAEIDGKQHHWFADYDEGRTEVLERLGVRVIRFSNAEVRDDLPKG